MRNVLAILVAAISVFGITEHSQGSSSEYVDKLERYVVSEEASESHSIGLEISNPEKWVIEAGESAIPILRPLLSATEPQRQFLGAYLLAVIGGPTSRDLLQKEYDSEADIAVKSLLCLCMASTGDPKDVDFLIDSLKGPHYGYGWPPIEAAALSLGILRPLRAIPALKACADKNEGIASQAAEQSLSWINKKVPLTPQIGDAPERERLILTMFRFGIPRVDESSTFYETDRTLKWLFREDAWKFQKIDKDLVPDDAPTISFDVYINQNRSKALVAVGLTFGPLNGKGYNYILKKENGQWKVVGIMSTWIS